MASLKKLMKTAQVPWTLMSFVRWWWAKLVQIYFKKAKNGIDLTTSPWPCAKILEVVMKLVASCCCLYYFTVPPFYGSLKPQKASLNIPAQKMDQFSTPISSVYVLFPIHHTVLTTTQSNILTFDLSLKSFEYIHIIRWLMNGSQRFNFLYWQIIE